MESGVPGVLRFRSCEVLRVSWVDVRDWVELLLQRLWALVTVGVQYGGSGCRGNRRKMTCGFVTEFEIKILSSPDPEDRSDPMNPESSDRSSGRQG